MRGDGERKKREGERERKSADEEAFRVGEKWVPGTTE